MGVVGVAVSPVLGVTDGLNSVAQTLFIQSSEGIIRSQMRPARAFFCSDNTTTSSTNDNNQNQNNGSNNGDSNNSNDKNKNPLPQYPMLGGAFVLSPVSLLAAQAQAAIVLRAKKKGELDYFVGFCALDKNKHKKGSDPINYNTTNNTNNKKLSLTKGKVPMVILSVRYLILIALHEVLRQGDSPRTETTSPKSPQKGSSALEKIAETGSKSPPKGPQNAPTDLKDPIKDPKDPKDPKTRRGPKPSKSLFFWSSSGTENGFEILSWNGISHFYQFGSFLSSDAFGDVVREGVKEGKDGKEGWEERKERKEKGKGEEEMDAEIDRSKRGSIGDGGGEGEGGGEGVDGKKGDVEAPAGLTLLLPSETPLSQPSSLLPQPIQQTQQIQQTRQTQQATASGDRFFTVVEAATAAAKQAAVDRNLAAAAVDRDLAAAAAAEEQYEPPTPSSPCVWGVMIVQSNGTEISVHCPTHKVAVSLSLLLSQNNLRVRRPDLTSLPYLR